MSILYYLCGINVQQVEEAIVRQLDAFTRFLQVAALSNTEIVNYTNIAQDCGVSAKTVKEYFSILELRAFVSYTFSVDKIMNYWRTLDNKYEVAFNDC